MHLSESEPPKVESRVQFSLRHMFSWTAILGILVAIPTMTVLIVCLSLYVLVGLGVVACLVLLQLPSYFLLKSHVKSDDSDSDP